MLAPTKKDNCDRHGGARLGRLWAAALVVASVLVALPSTLSAESRRMDPPALSWTASAIQARLATRYGSAEVTELPELPVGSPEWFGAAYGRRLTIAVQTTAIHVATGTASTPVEDAGAVVQAFFREQADLFALAPAFEFRLDPNIVIRDVHSAADVMFLGVQGYIDGVTLLGVRASAGVDMGARRLVVNVALVRVSDGLLAALNAPRRPSEALIAAVAGDLLVHGVTPGDADRFTGYASVETVAQSTAPYLLARIMAPLQCLYTLDARAGVILSKRSIWAELSGDLCPGGSRPR